MGHDRQPCPLDGSRLVRLGSSWGEKGVDLSVWYCPRCDVGFVLLCPTRSEATLSVLRWHRRDGLLELRKEDRSRWEELPRQFRECWESNVRYHVESFLRSRHAEGARCRLDGTCIPVLHQWVDAAGTPWRLSWCRSCGLGFVSTSSADYGWECCASVAWESGRCEVWEEYRTGAGHAVSPRLAELPPLKLP